MLEEAKVISGIGVGTAPNTQCTYTNKPQYDHLQSSVNNAKRKKKIETVNVKKEAEYTRVN